MFKHNIWWFSAVFAQLCKFSSSNYKFRLTRSVLQHEKHRIPLTYHLIRTLKNYPRSRWMPVVASNYMRPFICAMLSGMYFETMREWRTSCDLSVSSVLDSAPPPHAQPDSIYRQTNRNRQRKCLEFLGALRNADDWK